MSVFIVFSILLDLCKPNDISLLHTVVQTPEEELGLTIEGSDDLIKEIDSSTAIQEGI
jgi:hypothetical protein